jgi:lysophospholipase L1-like esterase
VAEVQPTSLQAAAIRELVREIQQELAAEQSGEVPEPVRRLVSDLKHIQTFTQEAGIQMILLAYPRPEPGIQDALKGSAQDLGIPLASAESLFAKLLAQEPFEKYFIPDGHCNDAGYRLVAEEVADVLLQQEP